MGTALSKNYFSALFFAAALAMPFVASAGHGSGAFRHACDTVEHTNLGKAEVREIGPGIDLSKVSNEHCTDGRTPLIAATAGSQVDNVRLLISLYGARPDFADRAGKTPLLHAVDMEEKDIVVALAKGGANMNLRDSASFTPLMHAILNFRSVAVIEALLKNGGDTALTYDKGITPLMMAAGLGEDAMVRAIMSGALLDYAMKDEAGTNALMYAVDGRSERAVRELAMTINALQKTPAAHSGAVNINSKNNNGYTALIGAVRADCADCAGVLLSLGADADMADNFGYSPLIHAAATGRTAMAQLLAPAANKDARDNTGSTALMHAAHNGMTDMVNMLLTAGADARLRNNHGLDAWEIARRASQSNVLQALNDFHSRQ